MTEEERIVNDNLIGVSASIRNLRKLIVSIANTNIPVLVRGETGTGKDLVTKIIHGLGNRKTQPFVSISLPEISAHLFESELFGHLKGSFTDARDNKIGLFMSANNGSIFLDEIDDLPMELQSKLLRIIDTGELRQVGSHHNIKINVRIIAATKKNLTDLIKLNLFREDLYYRLNGFQLLLPPLRERTEDIPYLIEHFIDKIGHLTPLKFTDEVMALLLQYTWPGNVRELKNIINRFCTLKIKFVDALELSNVILHKNVNNNCGCLHCANRNEMKLHEILHCVEKKLLSSELIEADGKLTTVAQKLGLLCSTLSYKLKRHGLEY